MFKTRNCFRMSTTFSKFHYFYLFFQMSVMKYHIKELAITVVQGHIIAELNSETLNMTFIFIYFSFTDSLRNIIIKTKRFCEYQKYWQCNMKANTLLRDLLQTAISRTRQKCRGRMNNTNDYKNVSLSNRSRVRVHILHLGHEKVSFRAC